MRDLLDPVTLLCGGAVAFWAQEKKWPDSVEDVAALPGADDKWLTLLSRFSDVVFTPQSDRSVVVSGKTSPPSYFAGSNMTTAAVMFSATITMQPAPETNEGWTPQIEASITDEKGAPNQRVQPNAGSRPSSGDSSPSETPSKPTPRG